MFIDSDVTRGVHEKIQGGFVNTGGWGTRKNSVTIPRGVHAARQKHAPCVEMWLNRRAITTYIQDIDKWYKKCDIIAGQN